MTEVKLLLLLWIANGAPILARHLLGSRFENALDGGRRTMRGAPWLGPSKTVRGLIAAVLLTSLAAPLLGYSWESGVMIGLFAMLGDLFASFIKRRLGLPPSSQAKGLDQIPESLFPMIYCSLTEQLAWSSLPFIVAAFWLSEVLISRLLHRIGIRRHPY